MIVVSAADGPVHEDMRAETTTARLLEGARLQPCQQRKDRGPTGRGREHEAGMAGRSEPMVARLHGLLPALLNQLLRCFSCKNGLLGPKFFFACGAL